jgi:cytochrome P450
MDVIGMLLGIPEADRRAVQALGQERIHREPGQPGDYGKNDLADASYFGEYADWRFANPSDDLMTSLLHAEIEDESGISRKLTREEILTFVNVLSNAGNETTNRLIGWIGKVLADHPDQRQDLVRDRTLIPNAVEEILRFEPPSLQACRYVTRPVEYYGHIVPEGSVMMFLTGAANRDHRAFPPDGDVLDVRRAIGHHLAFGYGIHFCLGAALARLEGRVVLEEVLNRFPEWQVDTERAVLDSAAVRGWASLPVVTA